MSLYESIAFRICELVLTLRESHFQFVETLLFKQLLSEQTVCSLLASDVLTFTSRVSTHPLCYQFCSVLMTISSHLKDSELPNVSSLINRLIPFLTSLEMEYLLKDYDLIKCSRVWGIPNISRVLTSEQIKQYLEEFKTFIDNGKPLNKYDFNLFRNLLIANELDQNYRNYCFEKFFKLFVTQKESTFYSDFIDLITITLPNQLNNTFIEKMLAKLNQIFSQTDCKIALDLVFIEKLMVFLTHLTLIQIPISMEKLSIRLISSYIVFIHKNSNNFYAKYLTLNALKEISLKSSHISIVDNCCKDEEVREDFVEYLNKIKVIDSL